jgi:hypothetical protein
MDTGLPSVNARGIGAGTARHGAIRGQATVEEEPLAENDFAGVCGLTGGIAARCGI